MTDRPVHLGFVRRLALLAAQLDDGEKGLDFQRLAKLFDVNESVARVTISQLRLGGLITHPKGKVAEITITPKGRKAIAKLPPEAPPPGTAPSPKRARAASPAPAAPAPVTRPAPRAVQPPPTFTSVADLAAARSAVGSPERFTATEMRELLEAPRSTVRLIRRALSTSWFPGLLDALEAADETSETAPAAPPASPKTTPAKKASQLRVEAAVFRRAAAERSAEAGPPPKSRRAARRARRAPEPVEEELEEPEEPAQEPDADDGPIEVERTTVGGRPRFLLIGSDDQTLGEHDSLAEAIDEMKDDDDADHVFDTKTKKIVARKGVDDADETEDEDAAE